MPVGKRKCRQCKQYGRPEDGQLINGGYYCSEPCVIAYAMANRAKGRKAQEKEHRRQKREYYQKDIKTRREAAVYWFNRFIRLRDAGSPCISCGASNSDIQYHAGHFIPAGSSTALRFDEKNCHLQCARCNLFRSGALAEYRVGLEQKIGAEAVAFLEGPQPTIKITATWYKSIEDKYKAKCKLV